ncbi:MAG: phosphoglucosamine mutase [Gammaproteobacteria bacterium]|nr:phosphoglucosamine mutase [Gammaproteobacteria bacterium]
MGNYFGTDGVRGLVGEWPMSVNFAVRLASAAGRVMVPDGGSVVVGKDPRISGYMFESALEAGFVAAGANVKLLQVMPTPGIAYLTRVLGADLGVVISASHNSYHDNGIKFFDRNGAKLSDDAQAEIEKLVEEQPVTRESSHLGRAERRYDAVDRYLAFCKQSFPESLDLSGMRIVIDGANGATYKIAPRVFSDLGADVITIGCSPNGKNINDGCGSTCPALLQSTVTALGADLGVAFDGDGDRVAMVDAQGQLVDGDQLVYVIAMDRKEANELTGPVVGTVMSNLGLEKAFQKEGIEFLRAPVGDRHVMSALTANGGVIGGETSGHIICLDRTTTGDGIIGALQVLAAVRKSGKPLHSLCTGMTRYPQKMINVRMAKRIDIDNVPAIGEAVERAEHNLSDRGRVVLRPSGTEPVVRVMVEGESESEVNRHAEELAAVVAQST